MILGEETSIELQVPEWNPGMAGCGNFESSSEDSDVFEQLISPFASGISYLLDVDESRRACSQEPANKGTNTLQETNAQSSFTLLDVEETDTALPSHRAATCADATPQADVQPSSSVESEPMSGTSIPSLEMLHSKIAKDLPMYSAARAAAMPERGCIDLPEPKRKKRRTTGYRSSQDSGDSSPSTTISRNGSYATLSGPLISDNNTQPRNQQSINYRFWSLEETKALVEGVARCGNGKWAIIKKLSFAAIEKRSPVDLKDKWRNLTRIAMLPPDQVKQDKKRDMACPPELLKRVREIHNGQAAAMTRASPDSGSCESNSDNSNGFVELNSEQLTSGDFLLSGNGMLSSEDDKAFVLPQPNAQGDLLSSLATASDPFSMVESADSFSLLPAWLNEVDDLLDGANDLAFPHQEQQVTLMASSNFPSSNLAPLTIPLYPQQLVPVHVPLGSASDLSPQSTMSSETPFTSPGGCGTKLAETKKVKGRQTAPAANEISPPLSSAIDNISNEKRSDAVVNSEEPDVDAQVHGGAAEDKKSQNTSYRFWSLEETKALVEGVARCGNGKWAVIKKLSFEAIEKRSPVDLKDKWRNLTRIAMLPPDEVKQDKKRDMACPPELLERVREIAKLEATKKQTGRTRRRGRGQNRGHAPIV